MENDEKKLPLSDQLENRRGFIKKASLITLSTIGISCQGKKSASEETKKIENSKLADEPPKPKKKPVEKKRGDLVYRPLGKTGLRASDISFGSGGIQEPRVVLKALDMGMNYFDTAPDYSAGRSEKVLGKAFKKMSLSRDKIVVATKMCKVGSYPKHYYHTKKETLIKGVEGSLKRLNTDYVDFLFVHALGERSHDPETYRLDDPEMLEATATLKKDGKIRFLAVSSHNYIAAIGGGIEYAIKSGNFDLIMTAFSYGKPPLPHGKYVPQLEKLSKMAYDKGIAHLAMKSLKGARGLDPAKRKGQGTFAQAALKWILTFDTISSVVISIKNMNHLDAYTQASGQKLTQADEELLYKWASTDDNCQIGCYECEASCPKDVHVCDILRYNMYFKNYDREKNAMIEYSRIPASKRGDACKECEAPCETACSFGVPVRKKLAEADRNLAFV